MSSKLEADIKDLRFPSGTLNNTVPNPFLSAIRKIQEICDQKPDAIIFCGDLTTGGNLPRHNLEGYKECVNYLCKALKFGPGGKWSKDQVQVVPANHDVVREFCHTDGNNWQEKFAPLVQAWTAVGFPVLSAEAIRKVQLSANGLSLQFYAANSCVGCGVTREYFAPQIRDELENIIKKKKEEHSDDVSVIVNEVLDTPAFDSNAIEIMADEIKSLKADILPVVVAHHNLLPQATVRVALYTELLNAGHVRTHLTNCERLVLYCHGHIHDNPIEIIQNVEDKLGRILCISAPCIIEGFNTIRIESSLANAPLGCVITCYVKTRACDFQPKACRLIRIHTKEWRSHCDPKTHQLINILNPKRIEAENFACLVKRAFKDLQMDAVNVRLRLLEAEWLGAVELSNHRDLQTGEALEDFNRCYIRRI
jgi:hypothetical protein